MKILKIFGVVVGIHVFALILIFANPGCSSSTKPPASGDTAKAAEPAPSVTMPAAASESAFAAAPTTFDPNAPAIVGASGTRSAPTRPNTVEAGALAKEPVAEAAPASSYTVVSGDNLSLIAKKKHITVAELTAANHMKATTVLRPGQKLLIPAGKPAAPSATAAAPGGNSVSTKPAAVATSPAKSTSSEGFKHVVKPRETLSTIAKQYGVSQRELGVANNITDPLKLQLGAELVIPGYLDTSSKSGRPVTKSGSDVTKKSGAMAQPVALEPEPLPAIPDVPVIKVDDSPFAPAPKK